MPFIELDGALDALPALPLDRGRQQQPAVLTATGTDSSRSSLLVPMLAPNPDNRCKLEATADKSAPTTFVAAGMEDDAASLYGVKEKQPLSIADSGFHKRGRRDLNPQPPDRQSGTLTN